MTVTSSRTVARTSGSTAFRSRLRATGAVAAIAGLTFVASACGRSTVGAPAGSTTVKPAATTSTIKSKTESAAAAQRCQANQLRAAIASHSAAASSAIAGIELLNSSHSTCSLDGYPGIALMNSSSGHEPLTVVNGGITFPGRAPKPAKTVLSPGQPAYFDIQWNDAANTCDVGKTLVITLPGRSGAIMISTSAGSGVYVAPCGSSTPQVEVSAFGHGSS